MLACFGLPLLCFGFATAQVVTWIATESYSPHRLHAASPDMGLPQVKKRVDKLSEEAKKQRETQKEIMSKLQAQPSSAGSTSTSFFGSRTRPADVLVSAVVPPAVDNAEEEEDEEEDDEEEDEEEESDAESD